MTAQEKLIRKLLSGSADANIEFQELRNLLISLGFSERTKGSHHVFFKHGIGKLINLQREGRKAKPYQVQQVRAILVEYRLISEEP